jgi:hypothetical protein
MFVLLKYFPKEIVLKILEYDNTYYELFNNCLLNLVNEVNLIKFYWSKGYTISLKTIVSK